jgi:hypothetical protein
VCVCVCVRVRACVCVCMYVWCVCVRVSLARVLEQCGEALTGQLTRLLGRKFISI